MNIMGNNKTTKQTTFDIPVVSFPYPDSNVSSKVILNCFYSQLVRFATLCTDLGRFYERTNMLFIKLVHRDISHIKLLDTFDKFLLRYKTLLLGNNGKVPSLHPFIILWNLAAGKRARSAYLK